MRRVCLAILAGLLLSGQNVLPGFPPGVFLNRSALDAPVSSALACSNSSPVTVAAFNVAYTGSTPSATGGAGGYTYSKTGTLPTGFSISGSTGVISGTDTTDTNNTPFTGIQITVTDSASNTANCGSAFQIAIYAGPGDVVSGATAWYGLRAFTGAQAAAGATTTAVVDVYGQTTTTSCTIYLLGNSTGGLDFSTAGAGSVGHQCLLGATTFCTVTNTSCTVSKLYDKSGNGNNVTEANTSKQPTLTFNCLNTSLPCLTGVSASSQSLGGTVASSSNGSLEGVGIRTGTFTSKGDLISVGGGELGWYNSAGEIALTNGGTAGITLSSISDSAWHVIIGVFGASSSGLLYGDATGTTGTETFTASTAIGIMADSSGARFTNGQWAEAGYWGSTNFTTGQITGSGSLCRNAYNYWATSASC